MNSNQRTRPVLQRAAGVSLHRQVFTALRDRIIQGSYAPGALIPNEEELCATFGVSRITVRRAVADLERYGLLEKRQGRGTFVRSDVPSPRPAATLGFLESLDKTARETEVQVLRVEVAQAPRNVALQLQLDDGEPAVHASRLRKSGQTVLMVTEAWVPQHLGKKITEAALKKQALYQILMSQGVKFRRVVQEISAASADPYFAPLLGVEVGAPLLKLTRLLYDQKRHPVQHLTVYTNPERSRILMDVLVGSVNTLSAGRIVHDLTSFPDSKYEVVA